MYKEYAEDEAITNLVNKYYWEALKENKIIAVAQPDIEQKGIEADMNFAFTATVEVEPNIEPQPVVKENEKVEFIPFLTEVQKEMIRKEKELGEKELVEQEHRLKEAKKRKRKSK
jgi:FKBP-type peptidyl-prolyl cis-trans isomerase (trigger factor)